MDAQNLIISEGQVVDREFGSFQKTKHCVTRSGQRGITDDDFNLIMPRGTAEINPGGVYKIMGKIEKRK